MACCYGTVSFYYCYPETCPSDDHCCCDYECQGCCDGACTGEPSGTKPCYSGCTSTCGRGACCTCHRDEYGFAIKSGTPAECNWGVSCGATLTFAAPNCAWTVAATKRDVNGTPERMADLSPTLFTALGHNLGEGLAGTTMSNDGSFDGCICP